MEPVNAAISYDATGTVHALSSPAAPFAVCIWTSHIWRVLRRGCSRRARGIRHRHRRSSGPLYRDEPGDEQLVILTSC